MTLELTKIGGKNQKFKTETDALEFFASHGISVAPLLRGDGDSQGGTVSGNQSSTPLPPVEGGLETNPLK
jgi:hypothetical protein